MIPCTAVYLTYEDGTCISLTDEDGACFEVRSDSIRVEWESAEKPVIEGDCVGDLFKPRKARVEIYFRMNGKRWMILGENRQIAFDKPDDTQYKTAVL